MSAVNVYKLDKGLEARPASLKKKISPSRYRENGDIFLF